MKKLSFFIFILFFSLSFSKEIYIVSGGGYKLPLNKLSRNFEEKYKIKVNCIFGNMKQIINYAKKSSKVSLILGDEHFLNKSNLKILKKVKIGEGQLILAFRNNLSINQLSDLTKEDIKRVGLPDFKKAIYGKASKEVLLNEDLEEILSKKLLTLKTVPQVSSYLLSGEIDAGFINFVDYQKLKDKGIKMLLIDKSKFKKINIFLGLIDGNNSNAKFFYSYFSESSVKEILKTYGISD